MAIIVLLYPQQVCVSGKLLGFIKACNPWHTAVPSKGVCYSNRSKHGQRLGNPALYHRYLHEITRWKVSYP